MRTSLCIRALALAFVAPAAAALTLVSPPMLQGLSPAESVALHARFDPSLGSLRAGRMDAPAPLEAFERAQLATAQQDSGSLEALRAGSAPSDHEWKWLAIGAGIVVLIILL